MVALQHGAAVINLTGRVASDSLCRTIVAHDARAIINHWLGGNVRSHNAQMLPLTGFIDSAVDYLQEQVAVAAT